MTSNSITNFLPSINKSLFDRQLDQRPAEAELREQGKDIGQNFRGIQLSLSQVLQHKDNHEGDDSYHEVDHRETDESCAGIFKHEAEGIHQRNASPTTNKNLILE